MPQDLSSVGWPLRTERLTIRPATPQDAGATYEIRRQPSVSDWLTFVPTDLASYTERFVDDDRLAKTLVVERDGVLVGDLMLAIDDAWAQAEVADRAKGVQAELGWVVAPEHAGQGYAAEGVAELVRVCFEVLRLRRVYAQCFADNVPSWRLMEKLGMRREEHAVRESLHRSGRWLDGLRYALLAEEWRATRAG